MEATATANDSPSITADPRKGKGISTSPLTGAVSASVTRAPGLHRALQRTRSRIFDVAWSPDGQHVATAGEGHAALLWTAPAASEPCPVVNLQRDNGKTLRACMRAAWLSEKLVLMGGADGIVSVHTATRGRALGSLRVAPSEIYGLTVLSSDSLLAVAANDTVTQWDLRHARRTAVTEFAADSDGVAFGGARNPDRQSFVFGVASRGRVLAAALSDGTCRLLDAQSLAPIHVLDDLARRGASCFACALSRTSAHLATASGDGAVLLYDLRALRRGPFVELSAAARGRAAHCVAFVSAGVMGPALGATGELCVTGDDAGSLRIATTHNGEVVSCASLRGPVLCCAVDPSNARVACGGGSGGSALDNALAVYSADAPPATASASLSPVEARSELAAAATETLPEAPMDMWDEAPDATATMEATGQRMAGGSGQLIVTA